MSIFRKPSDEDKLRSGAYSADGYYDAEPVPAETPALNPVEKTPGSTLNLGGNSMELKVVHPKAFAEVPGIADHLLAGCTVILNLESTDRDVCRRLMDFVSGVAYCIGGSIRKVAQATYIVSPNNVDVSETERAAGTVDPGL